MGFKIYSTKEQPTTIYRDESDRYYVYLMGNTINEESKARLFYRKKVQFKKGVDIKNKSKIAIKDAFLSPYRFEIEDEKTKAKNVIKGDKIIILDFEVVEEGIDEKQKIKDYSQSTTRQNNDFKSNTNFESENNPYDKFSYGGYSPF